jgi:thiol:disulfide interchange protein DsbD
VFISIGIGLGLPFFLIGLFPKTIRLLPKPGEWMNTLKVILGFGLLAFAIYMVSWLITSPQAKFVVSLMHFLLVLSFAVWLYGRFVTPMHKKITQVIISILAILIIIAGANFILKTHILSESETETLIDDFWNIFSEEVLEIAVYENRPVFINFTAAWCSQCRINERVVLSTYEVRQAFTDRNTLMLKADFTRHCPVILNRLQLHGRAGVPLYLLFIPGEPEPIRLPEILTNRLVLNALEQVAIPNYIGDYYE